MKDLNCYARFLEYPGVEKLRTVDQNKASFLAPVTPRFVQRGPFLARTAGCSHFNAPLSALVIWQSAVFFLALHILWCGCARSFAESPPLGVRANRLFLTLCIIFLLMIFGCSQTPSAALHPPGTWAGFTVSANIPIDVRTKIGPTKPAKFHFWNELYLLNLSLPPLFEGIYRDNH